MNKKDLIERTKKFALDVTDIIDILPKNNKGQVSGRQLLKAATSVGANYRAACRAGSKAEFISKLGQSMKSNGSSGSQNHKSEITNQK